VAPTAAHALPLFNGLMVFETIHGPTDPDEFSWELKLSPGQDLEQIDDQNAGVYFEDDTLMSRISAPPAHDLDGTTVPTSLAVTSPNVITVTVHHRPDDPAALGGPFDYPIDYGAGWTSGPSKVSVFMPSPPPRPAPSDRAIAHLPGTQAVKRLVKHMEPATSADCQRLESRQVGVGRWRCEVGFPHGDGVLLLWAWLSRERTTVSVKTHAFGDARAFSLISW
jgi:hypothetical protein